MKRLAIVMAASAALASAGCSLLGRAAFEQPVVKLKDVRLAGVGVTGGSLSVILSVYNPNHFRLDATRLTYQVNLAGDSVTVANGEVTDKFTVEDNATQDVTIPVTFTYAGLGAAGKSILNTGAVNYHVLGEVSVGSTVGTFKVPYSSTGRFTATGVNR
ncbi:MAG: LEA type 2 family protein [bacterium]